jgi:uncharacterized protein YcbK (DUF882 family)
VSKWFNEPKAEGLNEKLLEKLDQARDIKGSSIVITSGLRTFEENESIIGSVEDSSHVSGRGVDLRAASSTERYALVKALLGAGFKRIGVYDRHIHADTDETKDQYVMWTGKSH